MSGDEDTAKHRIEACIRFEVTRLHIFHHTQEKEDEHGAIIREALRFSPNLLNQFTNPIPEEQTPDRVTRNRVTNQTDPEEEEEGERRIEDED
jgi:hypothetical protein